MKFSYNDYLDEMCTKEQYRAQFNPPVLEVGSVYIQAKGTWHEMHYIILSIDKNVAFAKCVFNKISDKFIGEYELFNVSDGWKYQDSRTLYRLSEKIQNKIKRRI